MFGRPFILNRDQQRHEITPQKKKNAMKSGIDYTFHAYPG
jgi:hypothetical protein